MSSAESRCLHHIQISALGQILWTLIRLLLDGQSDLGPHVCYREVLKGQADDTQQTILIITTNLSEEGLTLQLK